MVETTQLNKVRQKRLRSLKKTNSTDDKPINTYFYPQNNLYTRQEFELLDSIYSDEPPGSQQAKQEAIMLESFWPQSKEEYLHTSAVKSNLLTKLNWFFLGVILTSVVWLIYFQLNVNQIRTKNDTQIVFQKSMQVLTDKTADKQITKNIETQKTTTPISKKFAFPNWFSGKQKESKKEVKAQENVQTATAIKHHIVINGDSLWLIANKYYSNPSEGSIKKIMEANNMKRIGILTLGQKLVIP